MFPKRIAAAAILALFPFAALAVVPPVPDSDRYASYALSSPTVTIGVPFAVYGDCTDIQVLYNGAPLALGSQWACSSVSGVALNLQALPITDMQVTLSPALSTGTLEIVGLWHPRNTSMSSAPGITRQEFNGVVNTIISSLREVKRFVTSFPEAAGYILTSQGPGLPPVWGRAPTAGAAANFTGDTGSGGLNGLVPPPSAGQGASGYLLSASGSWVSPTLGGSIANLSGSAQTTTAACTAGNATVTLALAKDFVNGQGIALEGCGATFSSGSLSNLQGSPTGAIGQGPTGGTTYAYEIACVDANGGVGPASSPLTISNGAATLGVVSQSSQVMAYNHVSWATSCAGVAVWRNRASAGYQLLGIFGQVGPGGLGGNFIDDTGLPVVTIPWVPATPPASASNDRLVTTVVSGGGTASLVLAAAPANSSAAAYTRHDDTAAINTYLASTKNAVFPAGSYNVENILIPSTVASFRGAGQSATSFYGWTAYATVLSANSMPGGFNIADFSVYPEAPGNVVAVSIYGTLGCQVRNLGLSGSVGLYLSNTSRCLISGNQTYLWYNTGIFETSGQYNTISNNIVSAGSEAPQAVGVYLYNTSYDHIDNNTTLGGEFFAFNTVGFGSNLSVGNSFTNNAAYNSFREMYHVSGFGQSHQFVGNYAYGGTTSIDFCVSISDDTVANVVISSIVVANNSLNYCGGSAVGVAMSGGTSPTVQYTTITGNTIFNSNASGLANIPDVVIDGSGTSYTMVNANTFMSGSGRVNYLVQEIASYGTPSYTQVGSMFGLTGSAGSTGLIGTGSVKLTGGSSGL